MFDKLNEHRKATIKAQKVAWQETINERLSKCEKDIVSIPIVIWGLEASPSYFDKHGIKKIGANKLHENYLYNTAYKNGNNYGVKLIKNWLNNERFGEGTISKPPYSYDSLKTQLSNANFKLSLTSENSKNIEAENAIHLVYDIFPEWHGLPVTGKLRDACFNKHYMCEKIRDFNEHIKDVDCFFSNQNPLIERGKIHFVWLGTKQANKQYPGKKACATFFCCLKKNFEKIGLYYNPEGFVNKSELEVWKDDCPADFSAIGVPTDWSEHIVQAGYHTVAALRNEQPTAVCQNLNGFKEEKKLEIPILELNQVESWF